jgi:AmiR/NasT family two-component response regulator
MRWSAGVAEPTDDDSFDDLTSDDEEIVVLHQATGVVMWQMGLGAREARACLRVQADAVARAVPDVARDLVSRRLRITPSGLVAE